MNTRTQSFLLLLFGAALLRLASGDVLLRYVRPVARPWIMIAGAAIAFLALWSIVADLREKTPVAAGDVHGHSGASRAAWLVVAPVVVILVVAPPALGAFSVSHASTLVADRTDAYYPPLQGRDPVRLTFFDLFSRAMWDKGRTLNAHQLSLTGFVVHRDPDGFDLARLVITCCAADAMPITVHVSSTGAPPPQDAWVTITGTCMGIDKENKDMPIMRALTIAPAGAPSNPYDS